MQRPKFHSSLEIDPTCLNEDAGSYQDPCNNEINIFLKHNKESVILESMLKLSFF